MLHRVNAAYASYSWWNIMLQIFSSSCLRTRMPWLHLRHQSCIMTRNPNLDLSKHLLHLSSILISYFLLQIGWIDGWMDGWIRLLMWQIGVVIKQTITNSLTSIEQSQHLLRTPIGNRANNGAHWMGLSVTGCLMQLVWWESSCVVHQAGKPYHIQVLHAEGNTARQAGHGHHPGQHPTHSTHPCTCWSGIGHKINRIMWK